MLTSADLHLFSAPSKYSNFICLCFCRFHFDWIATVLDLSVALTSVVINEITQGQTRLAGTISV
ncbi:hypothetical protein M404DRAFT_994539 [Pisolithus tinctorius Marx 270]|uniref:Uncharacterized protein n=1 Tax=Pisolithus tinctorius Marx 270 TaxID=870435 RepID=A0A0C3KQT6_PISTI|nr:hypothetical protein M404DRAFT_994539 [Pisolithus tinctorius Marx 270]